MTTAINHPRYREIFVEEFDGQCPQSDADILRIILFSHDEELRSHTVKHLLNLQEMDTVWQGMLEIEPTLIHQSISRLQEIGCPGMTLKTFTPPCKAGGRICSFFDECGEIILRLEDEYLRIVEKVLEEGAAIPRYACFYSKAEQYNAFCLMPDRPAVVKASAVGNNVYNLMTCYSNPNLSFAESLHLQSEKIRSEARRGDIVFRTESSWEVIDKAASNKKSKKSVRKRYKKAKYRNWRGFLDEME